MKLGYARVSTDDQRLDLQQTRLTEAGAIADTFPSMDASRSARAFVAVGIRVSAAAIHSVSTTTGRWPR